MSLIAIYLFYTNTLQIGYIQMCIYESLFKAILFYIYLECPDSAELKYKGFLGCLTLPILPFVLFHEPLSQSRLLKMFQIEHLGQKNRGHREVGFL